MTAPQELRTTRLLLRSFKREDVPDLVRLAGAREIAATTINVPYPYTENEARDFLARADAEFRAGQSVVFAVTICPGHPGGPQSEAAPGGELCGAAGLTVARLHGHAELGYWIGIPFWGRGFATEAAACVVAFGFETLQLHRIYAAHFEGNVASRRVLEKIGMRHEGHSREHIRKWDRFVDVENYGMLAEEFRSGK